jgi:hypothetical protein
MLLRNIWSRALVKLNGVGWKFKHHISPLAKVQKQCIIYMENVTIAVWYVELILFSMKIDYWFWYYCGIPFRISKLFHQSQKCDCQCHVAASYSINVFQKSYVSCEIFATTFHVAFQEGIIVDSAGANTQQTLPHHHIHLLSSSV